MGKLEGKIALITGGNSGIGLATGTRFVNEGACTFITGRRAPELAAAVEKIGRNITSVQGDVADLRDLDRLFAQIKREKGRPRYRVRECRGAHERVLSFKSVIADSIKIKEGGRILRLIFDAGRDQLIDFMEPLGTPGVPAEFDAGINRGLGLPASFYHFAFEAGSEAALAHKRGELRAKGLEVTDIVDHGSKSIYFKDPNGLSREYCCFVRNLTKDDATMQESFSVRRAERELNNEPSGGFSEAQSVATADHKQAGHL
jgi:NAD(P)-dependent dehydrogenase (short-subunit alcohol dehydrogenase family)